VRRCVISSLGFAEVCSVDQGGKSGKLELDLKMPTLTKQLMTRNFSNIILTHPQYFQFFLKCDC